MVVQFDQYGRGQARAAVDNHTQIGGVVAGTVDQIVVGAEQAGLGHPRIAVRHHAVLAPPRVRRRYEAELARHADVVLDHLPGAPIGAEDRHGQRDAAIVARQPPLAQGFDALARMRHLGERRAGFEPDRLRGAVGEHCADAAIDKAVDRALGVFDGGDVVAPVDQRCDAGVDLSERPHQVGDVVVLGLVARRQVGMDMLEIIRRHPLRADAAQRRLPGVHVGVDQARHHDLVGGVDHLVGGRAEVAAHGLDGVAVVKELAIFHLADLGIERDQPAALDENALHDCPPVARNTTGTGRPGPDIQLAAQGLALGIGPRWADTSWA